MSLAQRKAAKRHPRAKPRVRAKIAGANRAVAAPDRVKFSIAFARNAGLLGGGKTVVLRGRMPPALVKLAKTKTGIASDTELLKAALAHLVATDDYGDWLIAHRGSIPADIDLGL
jgi:hypothetical protein